MRPVRYHTSTRVEIAQPRGSVQSENTATWRNTAEDGASSTALANRVVTREKQLRARVRQLLVAAIVPYAILVVVRFTQHFDSDQKSESTIELTLNPGDALGVLAVLATLVVATNVAAWIPGFTDPVRWERHARKRVAVRSNELLGLTAAFTVPATLLHDVENPVSILRIVTTVSALAIVYVAVDGTLTSDPEDPIQMRIRKAELDNEIKLLISKARDLDASSALPQKSLWLRTAWDVCAIILSTTITIGLTALGYKLATRGIEFTGADAVRSIAGCAGIATISTVFAIYFGFFPRRTAAIRDYTYFAAQTAIALVIYLMFFYYSVAALWASAPAATVARILFIVFAALTPLALILLGASRSRMPRFLPQSPRLHIDRAI